MHPGARSDRLIRAGSGRLRDWNRSEILAAGPGVALHLHRSNRGEALVDALSAVLQAHLPADPFGEQAIVVGSRGMERWIRHELATRRSIATRLAFPFPRQALAGAARWLLEGATPRDDPFWAPPKRRDESAAAWEGDALAWRLLVPIRAHLREPEFEAVARYLSTPGGEAGAVSARELLFAREVGDALDRLMHDRPEDALAWATTPASADGRHRWLATLLAELRVASDAGSPALLHSRLVTSEAIPTGRTLCVFGLSTLGPGDLARLQTISRSLEVHLFVLIPTHEWIADLPAGTLTERARSAGADELDEESHNPLLAALAQPSRDLQRWLEDRADYQGDLLTCEDPCTSDDAPLLHRLQSWVLAASGFAAIETPWPHDGSSIGLHACYGPLRQCEVLREELLAMFADDPRLEPRDVVVMTPDIETYAPLVAAVFSRTGKGADGVALPRIPVSIADLGLSHTNPIADVLLAMLELAGERLTANRVLDLLALEPVRRRWHLDEDDLADLRALVRESGLRWGVDARDRAAVDQPELDQNTMRFALERLALGVLMPDEDDLATIAGDGASLRPAVPLPIEGRERVRRVGVLLAFLRVVADQRATLRDPATLAVWRERLATTLDQLTATAAKASWLRVEVDELTEALRDAGDDLGALAIEPAALARWLRGRFEIPSKGDRMITGAVQVCALEPMRSVPFRVVALLGMNDETFPRAGRLRTWDPMEQRRPGERDRRDTDRHLLLEALLSARERLLVLWSGHEQRRGKELAAAVPVEELIEILGRCTGRRRGELVTHHPLQPWSAANFGATPRSHDEAMAAAARRLREIADGRPARELGLAAGGREQLPQEAILSTVLELDALADALVRPQRLLLRGRLGLSLGGADEAIDDREPLDLDELETWSVRDRILRYLLQRPESPELSDQLRDRLGGEGVLPIQAGGDQLLRRCIDEARAIVENLDEGAGPRTRPLALSVRLDDGLTLVGCVEDVRRTASGGLLLQWPTAGEAPNRRSLLLSWLHLLAARAAGEEVEAARVVGYGAGSKGTTRLVGGGDVAAARALLGELAQVWRLARRRALPLFANTSAALGEALARDDDLTAAELRSALLTATDEPWHGSFERAGDRDDRWVAALFADYDPAEEIASDEPLGLIDLARRVWVPVYLGVAAGKAERARGSAAQGVE